MSSCQRRSFNGSVLKLSTFTYGFKFSETIVSDAGFSCEESTNDVLLTTLPARSQITLKICRLEDELVRPSVTISRI
jgi:hypothetical protein